MQKISEVKTRETTREEQEVLEWLNELRQSGATNMFGAGSYVVDEFGVSKQQARKYVTLWMANFNLEGNYNRVICEEDGE